MKYQVKKRWTLLGIAMVAVLGGAVFIQCFYEPDPLGYLEVQQRANPALSIETNENYQASQQKTASSKELWRVKGDQRLKAVLESSQGQLAYEKNGESHAIVEDMKNVRGFMQEELFYYSPDGRKTSHNLSNAEGFIPKQTVRFISADAARYHYTTETLDADHVTMKVYILDGHQLPEEIVDNNPVVTVLNSRGKFQAHQATLEDGVAIESDQLQAKCARASYEGEFVKLFNDIELKINDFGELHVSDELQLKRSPNGEIEFIRCLGDCRYRSENDEKNLDLEMVNSGEIFLDHKNQQIHIQFNKDKALKNNEKQVYFRNHSNKIFCDEALIYYTMENGSFSLKKITFNGNVRLTNRQGAILQYVLADHVTYDQGTEEVHFFGRKGKRVLLYDKINDLQVSAPEIVMQGSSKSKKPQFEGIGDVRFHFAEKEYEQLRKKFVLEKERSNG